MRWKWKQGLTNFQIRWKKSKLPLISKTGLTGNVPVSFNSRGKLRTKYDKKWEMSTDEFVREIWLTIEKLNRSCVSRGGHSTQVVLGTIVVEESSSRIRNRHKSPPLQPTTKRRCWEARPQTFENKTNIFFRMDRYNLQFRQIQFWTIQKTVISTNRRHCKQHPSGSSAESLLLERHKQSNDDGGASSEAVEIRTKGLKFT